MVLVGTLPLRVCPNHWLPQPSFLKLQVPCLEMASLTHCPKLYLSKVLRVPWAVLITCVIVHSLVTVFHTSQGLLQRGSVLLFNFAHPARHKGQGTE